MEDWPNDEGPLSDVDDDAEAADLVAAASGDGTILKRVIFRLYGRAGRRARRRRRAEGRIAIAVNRAAAERYARAAAAVSVAAVSRPVEQAPTSSALLARVGAPDVDSRYASTVASSSRVGPSCCRGEALSPGGGDVVYGSLLERSSRKNGARAAQPDDDERRPPREAQRTMFDYLRSARHTRAAPSATAADDAVVVTILPAAERLPSATAYTSLRRSWRRLEHVPPAKFTPYLGPSDEAHAKADKIMRKNGWAPPEWNSDGSDASDPDTIHHDGHYRSLPSLTCRLAQRAGVQAVVEALGESPAVVSAMSSALGETVSFLTHVIQLIKRRAADHRRASAGRAARAKSRAAIERLTGGASLAVVLGTGAVREQVVSPSVGECVAQVGRLGHEDLHGHQAAAVALAVAATTAASDVLAAGLPPASRAWATREAALVRESHADNGALRADVAALRSVHAALRAPEGPAAVTLLPCMGALFSTDHVDRADAVASECAPAFDFYGTSREVFLRLLCRTCLRYTCRVHGTHTVEPSSSVPVARRDDACRGRDANARADPDRVAGVVPGEWRASFHAASSAHRERHRRRRVLSDSDGDADGVGAGSARSRAVAVSDSEGDADSVAAGSAPSRNVAVSDSDGDADSVAAGSAPCPGVGLGVEGVSAGHPAACENVVGSSRGVLDRLCGGIDSLVVNDEDDHVPDSDVPVFARPSVSDGRRGGRAGILHASIAAAASGCAECRHDARVKAAMTYEKPTVDDWSDAQVALLHLGADIVGDGDTCLLARFVPGKTCRGVADYIAGAGWTGRGMSHVQPPDEDVDVDAAARDSSTPVTGAGAAFARGLQQTHTRPASPPLSLGAFSSPGRTTNGSSQEDPDAPDKVHDFMPCFHVGACTAERCRCARAGLSCEKSCWCALGCRAAAGRSASSAGTSLALIDAAPASASRHCDRRTWCACVPPSRCATDECPCFSVDRECDPDACLTCGAHWNPDTGVDGLPTPPGQAGPSAGVPPLRGAGLLIEADVASDGMAAGEAVGRRRCRNVQLQVGARVRCVLGRSGAHGLGVFAAEPAAAGDFVGEYVGELLSNGEAHARGRVYDAMGVSFLYSVTKTVNIDAKYKGNRTKFINHRRKELANVEAKLLNVSGQIRVGLFARAPLAPGEELFFDYGYDVPGWV